MLFSIQFITQLTIFAEAMLACSAFGKSSSRCSQPRMRKEWRTLSSHEQKSYLDAIQCLMVAPSKRKGAFNTLQSWIHALRNGWLTKASGGQGAPSLIDPPPHI
ncbi:hypothetical protein DER44DRAFT_740956 [Fusarium oxysporum]|nr:hypothetical protein DER44DRAFT_740956 [Fusarium oxysporum]